jgi:transposase
VRWDCRSAVGDGREGSDGTCEHCRRPYRSSCLHAGADCSRGSTACRHGASGDSRRNPLDGSLFLFINRRRDRLKILHWDGAGFWLYCRLLEAGTFETIPSDGPCAQLDSTQLAMLLGGVSLAAAKQRKRYRCAS